ncbi:hypothetical protein BCR34DRAFT_615843 [Clohesyomyces aquaticus]|uniref:Uncharacterized protein n=1 Tax=Clohesyomyces aquaticus TaxID=1231657 RepID=A0A1Y1ZGG1_9PLEO|nr:hypothetical protein BCR34DRAFT_615843 [Clohesyomyces aquaticus]
MLNLRCQILGLFSGGSKASGIDNLNTSPAQSAKDSLPIRERVFQESMGQLGIEDTDTWKAINNLVHCLSIAQMWAACGDIIKHALPAGIKAQVRAEGRFTETLLDFTGCVEEYLDWIEDVQGRDSEPAIEIGLLFPALCRHNFMLAIARQGRVDEAFASREAYREEILGQEKVIGALEARLEDDAGTRLLYSQTPTLADSSKLAKDGKWWLANKEKLQKAELLYGVIDIPPQAASQQHKGKHRDGTELLTNSLKKMIFRQAK